MYLPNSGFPVPLVRELDGPMHPGRVVAVFGVVPINAVRFAINLQCGAGQGQDIALHLSMRFPERVVVRNAFAGGWQVEEREGGFPLQPGQHFQILVLCHHDHWKIAINGNHFASFHHRMSFQRVTHIAVEGDVEINNVSGVVWAGAGAGAAPPGSRVFEPPIPHVQFIDSLFSGRIIRVQGRIPPDGSRFMFNLVSGPSVDHDDILFHVSYRAAEQVVVLNTRAGGCWGTEMPVRPCPVQPGQPFELLLLVDRIGYKVAINGVHLADFPHRMAMERGTHLVLEGHVRVQLVSLEGQRRDSLSFQPPPLPPPLGPAPGFPLPYEDYDHKYHFFPNPYPIIF